MMTDTSDSIYSDELTDLADAIAPSLQRPSHAKRAAHVVRTGRLALSPSAIAWITSIALHGTVIAAGIWIVTTLVHHAHLPADWGGGGGSSGGLVTGELQSQVAERSLPGMAPTPVEPTRNQPTDRTAVADVEMAGDRQTSINLDPTASSDAAMIGVPSTSSNATPHFGGHRPHPAGGSTAGSNPTSSPPGSDGVGDSGPGLPGVLLGSGPPAPDYPAESKRLGEQGTVRVAVEVLPDGTIGQIRVVSDPGFPRLRDASTKAAEKLRQFQLRPAFKGGKPIREFLVIPYDFKLR